jgi:microcystin-dependent protein
MKYRENESEPWKELYIKALDSMPIGSIIGFAGTDIPNGWLICDGSTLDEETYPELYDALGGSGSTFTLPNYQGRVPVGYDANDTDFNAIGKTGGEKTHTLTIDEMPSHYHQQALGGALTTTDQVAGVGVVGKENVSNTKNTGGDQPHNNLQPYIVQYWIIKAKNTTPTMASIVNTKNNSTTDGYSCDYINKLHTYSNTEHRVGTFVDGKPIYRKTIYIPGNLTYSGDSAYIDTNITNIDVLINFTGQVYDSTSGHLPIPYVNLGRIDYGLAMSMTNDNRILITNKAYNNPRLSKFVFNLEYTKTTD